MSILLARKQKSAILVVSSLFSSFPASGVAVYSGAKQFAQFLGVGLAMELAEKVDVTVYQAGEVATKLLRKRESLTVISAKKAAECSLRDLGKVDLTNGAMIHEIIGYVITWVPLWILQKMFFNISKGILKKVRAKESNKNQ